MSVFVGDKAKRLANDPTPSDDVILLVGYSDEDADIGGLLSDFGGELLEVLPYRSARVTIPEMELQEFADHPQVESIEVDSGMETLTGN